MNIKVSTNYSVYPGEFVPVASEEEIKNHLQLTEEDTGLPYISITELPGSYKIEAVAPGLERQECIAYANDNLLFICSVQDKKIIPDLKDFRHHIVLPSDADTELTVAEYKNSILHFYIPKTKQQFTHSITRIVVY